VNLTAFRLLVTHTYTRLLTCVPCLLTHTYTRLLTCINTECLQFAITVAMQWCSVQWLTMNYAAALVTSHNTTGHHAVVQCSPYILSR
jgi:hypothetical protein